MNTVNFLDALRLKLNASSDYKVHKFAGIPQQTVSQWRNGQVMSDEYAVKVADLLGMERAYVIACVNAERAKEGSETSGVWRQIADAFKSHAAMLAFVATLGFTGLPDTSHAAARGSDVPSMYIKLNRRRAADRTAAMAA